MSHEEVPPKYVIYRCLACKFTKRVNHPRVRYKYRKQIRGESVERSSLMWLVDGRPANYPEVIPCPNGCKQWGLERYLIAQVVKGKLSDGKCGARCLNAAGPNCDCQCAGENHGKNYDGATSLQGGDHE